MTAALYEVKNKLSEYVKIAEEGEPVEICKHGQPSVVMVSIRDYNSPKTPSESIFDKFHNRWLAKWGGGLDDDDFNEVWKVIERDRKRIDPERPNPFEED